MARQLKVKTVETRRYMTPGYWVSFQDCMVLSFGDHISLTIRAEKGKPLEISLEGNTNHRISVKPHSSKSLAIVVEEP
jgi:hypothetical protein